MLRILVLVLAVTLTLAPPPVLGASRRRNQLTLSTPNVLLPATGVYELTLTSPGCATFSSSNPAVVALSPPPPPPPSLAAPCVASTPPRSDCATAVTLTALSSSSRESVWVYARDVDSGDVARTEVFVDVIAELELLTSSRTVYTGDDEKIRVQGFDAEGNVFNSLGSLKFAWVSSHPHLLGLAPFVHDDPLSSSSSSSSSASSSASSSSSAMASTSSSLTSSSQILVHALQTGTVDLSVVLLSPQPSQSSSEAGDEDDAEPIRPRASATITVLEPLTLIPYLPTGMAIGTQIPYKLTTLNPETGETQGIPMPNARYTWESSHPDIVHVDPATGVATGLAFGRAVVSVADVDMRANTASASVYVTTPHHLEITASPRGDGGQKDHRTTTANKAQASPWFLTQASPYALDVVVMDADNNPMYPSANYEFETIIPSPALAVRNTSANSQQAWVSSSPNLLTGIVTSRLVQIRPLLSLSSAVSRAVQVFDLGPTPVEGQAEFTITGPLRLVPEKAVIPPNQKLILLPSGGSGSYSFVVPTGSAVHIPHPESPLVMAGPNEGSVVVTAHDTADASAKAVSLVDVSTPESLLFPPQVVEFEVGSVAPIALAVTTRSASKGSQFFTLCSALPIRFRITDPSLFRIESSLDDTDAANGPQGCTGVHIRALGEGSATLTASLGGNAVAELALFAYPPLTLASSTAASGGASVLVTLGTSATFTLEGGPAPWVFEPETHGVTPVVVSGTAASPSDAVRIHRVESTMTTATTGPMTYRVTCLAHSDSEIEFQVGNAVSESNPVPALALFSVQFLCQTPHSLGVLVGHTSLAPQCGTMSAQIHHNAVASSFTVLTSASHPISVSVRNAEGAVFDNAASLVLDWTTKNPKSAPAVGSLEGEAMLGRELVVGSRGGKMNVHLVATGYDTAMLAAAKTRTLASVAVSTWSSSAKLTHHLEVDARHAPSLVPDTLILVLDASNNNQDLSVRGGSGHVTFSSADTRVASVSPRPSESVPTAVVTPASLGASHIVATDACLVGGSPVSAPVLVAEVESLVITGPPMVLVGSQAKLELTAYTKSGAAFPQDQLAFLNIRVVVDDSSLIRLDRRPAPALGQYDAKALDLGTARVHAVLSREDGSRITSPVHAISVFPPLDLAPPEVHLVCGFVTEISVSGGPSRADLVYRAKNNHVASMVEDSRGEVAGLAPGSSLLTATASDHELGSVYASASVPISVTKLAGIRIMTPSPVVMRGGSLVLSLAGSRSEAPLSFSVLIGGRKPTVSWTIYSGESGAVTLDPVHAPLGASLDSEADMSVLVHGVASGSVTIQAVFSATIECDGAVEEVSFSDTVHLTVIPVLSLVSPKPCAPLLLLPPDTSSCIRTNRDGLRGSVLHYELIHSRGPMGRWGASGHDSGVPAGAGGGSALPEHADDDMENGPRSPVEVAVDDHGCVSAGSALGVGFVLVTDGSDGEFVLAGVRVAPVDHIALIPVDSSGSSSSSSNGNGQTGFGVDTSLTMGRTMEYVMEARDEMGRVFSVPPSGTHYKVEISHPSRVAVRFDAQGVMSITGLKQGPSVISVMLESEREVSLVIRVTVREAILPASPVVAVGGSVSFALSPAFVAGAPASAEALWHSSNVSVLAVDPSTGLGRALSPGSVSVHVTLGSDSSYTHVEVVLPSRVAVGTSTTSDFVSNVGEQKEYLFPVAVYGGGSGVGGGTLLGGDASLRIDHRVQLGCRVEPSGWVQVSVDSSGAFPGCVVSPLSAAVTDLLLPSTVDALTVIAYVDSGAGGRVEGKAVVPYAPAFSVFPSAGLSLSQAAPAGSLEVLGSGKHLVFSVTGSSERVRVSITTNSTSRVVATVALASAPPHEESAWSDVQVLVTHLVTGQRARVRVSYDPKGRAVTGSRPTRSNGRLDVPLSPVSHDTRAQREQQPSRTIVSGERDTEFDTETVVEELPIRRLDEVGSGSGASSSGFGWWYLWLLLVVCVIGAVCVRICALPEMQPLGTLGGGGTAHIRPAGGMDGGVRARTPRRTKGGAVLIPTSPGAGTHTPVGGRRRRGVPTTGKRHRFA